MNKNKITKNFGCKIANKILYMFRTVCIGKPLMRKNVNIYIQSDKLAKKRWHKTNYQLFFHYNNNDDEARISGFNFEHNSHYKFLQILNFVDILKGNLRKYYKNK